MKAVVTRQELLTSLLFASTDESRYVLNGVCLIGGNSKNRQPVMVATDGRRLSVIETTAEQPEKSEPGEIVLRADFIKAVASLSKALGGKLFPWIEIERKEGAARVTVQIVGGNCWLECESDAWIDQDYPKWRSVIPSKNVIRKPCSEIGLNAEYVGDYAKAARVMESETPVVQMSLVGGESAIEIKLVGRPNFYGLVMQTRLEEGTEYQPEFLDIVDGLPKPQPDTDPVEASAS